MDALDGVTIEVSVVLGTATVPVRQVLNMGRGAVIALDSGHDDPSAVHVNGRAVATGRVLVNGDHMQFEITDVLKRTGSAA